MKVLLTLAALFCVGIIGIAVYFSSREDGGGPRLVPQHTSYEQRITDGGWVRGNRDAKVTVVEYADLQCPTCRTFNTVMEEVYAKTKDTTKFMYRHYPLSQIHNKSVIAARATEAAGKQGKFWEMQFLLFARHDGWVNQTESEFNTTSEEYAKTLGLNVNQFKRDLRDSSLQDPIDKDVLEADAVFGTDAAITPTITINGTRVPGIPTAEELLALIQKAADAPQQ